MTDKKMVTGIVSLIVVAAATMALLLGLAPQYEIYASRARGQAALAEAESSKKIAIETARAKVESAKMEADAEVERARGVAEANKIIGDSLKGNESYLRYLWITGMDADAQKTVVYVPTEAGLPLLEAQRLATPPSAGE